MTHESVCLLGDLPRTSAQDSQLWSLLRDSRYQAFWKEKVIPRGHKCGATQCETQSRVSILLPVENQLEGLADRPVGDVWIRLTFRQVVWGISSLDSLRWENPSKGGWRHYPSSGPALQKTGGGEKLAGSGHSFLSSS